MGTMIRAIWAELMKLNRENEATTVLMRLKSDQYFQGKQNVEAYIDKFKELVNLSGYMDPIAIILKFHHGLNSVTQNRIAELGMDRPQDTSVTWEKTFWPCGKARQGTEKPERQESHQVHKAGHFPLKRHYWYDYEKAEKS
jgi:hypothetical protein